MNKLPEDVEIPFDLYTGQVAFTMARNQNNPDFNDEYCVRLSNEEVMPDAGAIYESRVTYSAPGGTNWIPRHVFSGSNVYHQVFGLRGKKADYTNENVWLQTDMGKPVNIDRITISAISQGDSKGAFTPVYTGFDKLPKHLRVDTGLMGDDGEIDWTTGSDRIYDLSDANSVGEELAAAYALVKDLDTATYAEYDAKGEERTPDEQAVWEAYRKIPTLVEIDLPAGTNARFYRMVILDPSQTEMNDKDKYEFGIYNIKYINKEKVSITSGWDSERLIKNVYGSGVVNGGSNEGSMFAGETNYSNGEGPDKAMDASSDSRWFSGNQYFNEVKENGLQQNNQAWLVVDLGREYNITGYSLNCKNEGMRPVDFRIQSGALTEDAAGATHAEKGINIITQNFTDQVTQSYPETTVSASVDEMRSGECSFRARYVRLYIDVTRRWADSNDPSKLYMNGDTMIHGFCLYGTPADDTL